MLLKQGYSATYRTAIRPTLGGLGFHPRLFSSREILNSRKYPHSLTLISDPTENFDRRRVGRRLLRYRTSSLVPETGTTFRVMTTSPRLSEAQSAQDFVLKCLRTLRPRVRDRDSRAQTQFEKVYGRVSPLGIALENPDVRKIVGVLLDDDKRRNALELKRYRIIAPGKLPANPESSGTFPSTTELDNLASQDVAQKIVIAYCCN